MRRGTVFICLVRPVNINPWEVAHNFIIRLLPWCIHRSSTRRHVAQGMHYTVHHLSLNTNIVKVGLLPKDELERIPEAYAHFRSIGFRSDILARGFKETYSRSVPIDFIGVWCVWWDID